MSNPISIHIEGIYQYRRGSLLHIGISQHERSESIVRLDPMHMHTHIAPSSLGDIDGNYLQAHFQEISNGKLDSTMASTDIRPDMVGILIDKGADIDSRLGSCTIHVQVSWDIV